MKRDNIQPGAGLLSLDAEREKAIAVLSRHFADDTLSLEELERRIERVYQAQTGVAVRDVTRDLPETAGVPVSHAGGVPEVYNREDDRIVSVMAQTVRRGPWHPARRLRVWSVMSETELDLTHAQLAPGVTEIHLTAVMTQVKIILPPGVRAVVQPGAFMAEVSEEIFDQPALGTGAPVVRITGPVVMAELKVSVRTRELLDG